MVIGYHDNGGRGTAPDLSRDAGWYGRHCCRHHRHHTSASVCHFEADRHAQKAGGEPEVGEEELSCEGGGGESFGEGGDSDARVSGA